MSKAKKRPHEPIQYSDPDNRPRPLTEQEIADLRADMKTSNTWALETIKERENENKES